MSSEIPSVKRSHLGSFPMFSNGKTAMEAFSDNEVDGVHHFQAVKPASSTSKTVAMEAARNPRGVGVDPELGCSVDPAKDQVLQADKTRCAVCMCPSVGQCE